VVYIFWPTLYNNGAVSFAVEAHTIDLWNKGCNSGTGCDYPVTYQLIPHTPNTTLQVYYYRLSQTLRISQGSASMFIFVKRYCQFSLKSVHI